MLVLQRDCQCPLTDAQKAEYEALDYLHWEASAAAEAKCRKFKDGAHGWCKEFARAEAEVQLWDLVLKRRLTRSIGKCIIRRKAKEVNVAQPLQYNLAEAHAEWLVANHHFQYLQKNSERRYQWLDKIAKARVTRDGGKFIKIRETLIRQEKQ